MMRAFSTTGIRLRRRVRTTAPARRPAGCRACFTSAEPGLKYMGDITCLPLASGEFFWSIQGATAEVILVRSNETRPPPWPPLQAPAPSCGQGVRHPPPAEMAARQAHRSAHRPQSHRIQRTTGPPPLGHRTHHVVAVRLPPPQPTLRTRPPQLPGLSRPRSRPLLLQKTRPPHHIGHGLLGREHTYSQREESLGL